MKTLTTLSLSALAIVLLGAGCVAADVNNDNDLDANEILGSLMDETSMPADEQTTPDEIISGDMADVTGGDAYGIVIAEWYGEDGRYLLNGEFSDLPELEDGYFYEGWVVRQEPLSVISTGALDYEAGTSWSNVFTADENLMDHTQYVLTLEPDDGDPAPAEHILEGDLQ